MIISFMIWMPSITQENWNAIKNNGVSELIV